MKKALVMFAAAMLVAGAASAFVTYDFHCAGGGNMAKVSPPVYTGGIDAGDMAPGTWSMTVDDTGWPTIADPAARWAYIWTHYYAGHFDGTSWTGTFDCDLYLEKTGYGTMTGVCDLTFQIIDYDGDGVMDNEECMDGLSGAVIIINEGSGAYADLCGNGSYSGSYARVCDAGQTYMDDVVDFDMQLNLDECGMSTDQSTWGAVKALFR